MIELIIVFACLVVPWAVFGLWWWFWLFIGICLLVVIFEIVAKVKTGQTLSQMFHGWAEENQSKAWFIVVCLGIGWLALVYHLVKGIIS